MGKKRGMLFILALLVMLVLSVLIVSFYLKSLGENQMARSYINSSRALWLAEAGIAKALDSSSWPSVNLNGSLDSANYAYSAQVSLLSGRYYTILSTGNVSLPTGNISRKVEVTVRTGDVDPTKFKYGIETTTDLIIRGSVSIVPSDSYKQYSTLDFADLFGITKAKMKESATHLYTVSNFAEPVDGITWVDVPTGNTLTISGNLNGSGILVINGNTHFSGTVNFHGIIYVIGELTMTGTVNTFGSILAESSATVDTVLKGNVTVTYSVSDISNALEAVRFLTKEPVAWKEA